MFYPHVFVIDMVSLSDQTISAGDEQKQKIDMLFTLIKKSSYFKKSLTITPSTVGDGAVVCFERNPTLPINLAIDLQKKLRAYNKNKSTRKQIHVRIGINTGLVFKTKGLGGKENCWGPGIIYATRIANAGEKNHILIDSKTANDLIEWSKNYAAILHFSGTTKAKHNKKLEIYSCYGNGFGNKSPPKNILNLDEIIEDGYGKMILEMQQSKCLTNSSLRKLQQMKEQTKLQLPRHYNSRMRSYRK